MKTVNFGFIGAGQISWYSVDGVNSHPAARVVAAQDVSAERLQALCQAKSIPKAYATAEELLADPEVDAVYIAVPNKFHAPLAIQALEAGKHVILDKPFAMNLAEAREVAAVAKRTGKVLTLGMNMRFEPIPQRIKTLVERGDLGEIYHAKAYWFRRAGIPKLGTWFGNKEIAGGGCLYDIGVHLLDVCLHLLGRFDPVSVSGATYTKFGNRGLGEGGWGKSDTSDAVFDVEDFATGLIRFADGLTVSLDVSWACHAGEDNRADVQLYGTEAGAMGMTGTVFRRDAHKGEYYTVQDLKIPLTYPHSDRFHNFVNHLQGTEALLVSIDQALVVQAVLDALAESARTGQEVKVDSLRGQGI